MAGTAGQTRDTPTGVPVARSAGSAETATPSAATPSGPPPALADRHDWSDTPLGGPDGWDPALRAAVELVLASPVPMALAYGDDFLMIYNDAYAELLGAKHPDAFARPAAAVFADSWHQPGVGDVVERVYRTGEPFLESETVAPFSANAELVGGTAYTRGYSAVRDSHGAIIGMLSVATETGAITHRLQSISELTAALAGTLTLDDVARVALRYGLASLDVDQVAFGIDDGGGWRVVRRVRGELLDEADERLPPVWRRFPQDAATPLATVGSTGVPRFTSDGRPLARFAADRHDERVAALAALPLRAGSLRGAMTFGYREQHQWAPAERALLSAVAELVTQAAERARRFETQHGTAQLLQRSMLPEQLPDLPTYRLAARYDPGVDGNSAGGDFYDAFRLPDGGLAVVLGDVAGHDVRAAALMGQVRAALRGLALTDPQPAAVLTGLDRLVHSLSEESRNEELFVTVLYGVLDPATGRLTLASAGHPAPLIRRPSSSGVVADFAQVPPGVPLGLAGPRQPTLVELRPGDTLLMFSDGVVERRGQDLGAGMLSLAAAVAATSTSDPRNLCAVASAAVAGTTDDDVAVLAMEHAAAPSRSAGLLVPAEPIAPSRVRHWLADQLAKWRVPEAVIGPAVLCASELTTNALLHAGTEARVEIDLSPERLLVSVADSGTRGTVSRARTDTLSSRGRGLGLIEQLSDAWGTDPSVRGSTVWFEIMLPASS
ncbi:ATP-binding SpoIIE family protein phosphatase [Micromonospora sp. NBC_01813]|uniref:ATP-binding SpoIIE family protein phosphatase n=1 Tax=Micromonospora sp. NBC_01813 TaxID=2975988 RepID=UPI002DDB8AA1|nr:SpoIIE family protein phosphatase [Micromonospora sp. NBC_01813]WSA11070.1 SpoIIE family protein phosphatase [Micromonospora sp. NBC_01813]